MPKAPSKARKIDFNAQWSGKPADLERIGKQSKGICGCAEYCHGSQDLVYGHVFRLHMSWKLSSRAFGASRSTSLGRLPSIPHIDTPTPPDPPHASTSAPSFPQDGPTDASNLPDTHGAPDHAFDDLFVTDSEVEEGDQMEGLDDEVLAEIEDAEGRDEDREDEAALLLSLEQEIADSIPINPTETVVLTAQDEFRLSALLDELGDLPANDTLNNAGTNRTHLSYGNQLEGVASPDDHILQWPFPIPTFLLNPPHAGNLPNPYLDDALDSTSSKPPLLSRIAPLLALTLSGRFGVPRRAVELVLRIANTAIRLAERQIYERMVSIMRRRFPEVDMVTWEELQEADPVNDDEAAPRSSNAALKSIGVDYDLIVHPQCRNARCHHVFYEAIGKDDLALLPPICPECSTPLRVRDNLEVLFFPRRLLWQELELVLAIPGVESAIESQAERKLQRDREDQEELGAGQEYQYVLREQDDGKGWDRPGQRSSQPEVNNALTITVNMGMDWANPSSNRSASAQSMGPITLFLADLPVSVRSAMACSMIVGITPGPNEPKAENLHKLLLPIVLELRSAQEHGIWVKTPAFPQGRLVRVVLGCLIADRPAAEAMTGAGHHSAKDSPCIRCFVTQPEIPNAGLHPSRVFKEHMRVQIEQYKAFQNALPVDQEQFAALQDKREREGKSRKHYSDYRLKKLRDKHYTVRGHISVFCLLPGFDAFANTPFDSMHLLLEGLTRAYFYSVLVQGAHAGDSDHEGAATDGGTESDVLSDGRAEELRQQAVDFLDEVQAGNVRQRTAAEVRDLKRLAASAAAPKKSRRGTSSKRLLGPEDLDRLQELMAEVQIPMAVSKLHPRFGSASAGTPSADDWRTFASVFAPLTLPRLWKEHRRDTDEKSFRLIDQELWAIMGICEIVILSMRSSLSDYQIDHLRDHIRSWSKDVFQLHPSLKRKTNFHAVSHLVEDIERFGPPYNTWSFAVERVNFIAKNVPQARSSSARQVSTLRAMMLARQVESLRSQHLGDDNDFTVIEKESAEDLDMAFRGTTLDKAATALDLLGIRYEGEDRDILDMVKGVRAGKIPVRLRGTGQRTVLRNSLILSLQACLSDLGVLTRRNAVPVNAEDALTPYLPAHVTAYEGMEWGRLRFDCASPPRATASTGVVEVKQLVRCRNSLFEAQQERDRYGMIDNVPMSGVLLMVFHHETVQAGSDGERIGGETRLFGVVREFKPYNGEDVYQLSRFSATGTRLWEADCLEDTRVVSLEPSRLAGFRPLAITRLPQDMDDEARGELWATQPIDRH